MAIRKPTSGQSSIREFRSAVAKLKAVGLVSARVDARSQAPTRYMRGQVRKFADVLSGKAKVVTAPKRSDLAEYREGGRYIVKGKHVVIPTTDKTERLRFDKKTKTVVGKSRQYGDSFTREYQPKPITQPQSLPSGYDIRYTIPLGRSYRSFDTIEDLTSFMMPYEQQAKNPYRDWQRYVILERHGIRPNRVSSRAA